jgi:hypothetical protein
LDYGKEKSALYQARYLSDGGRLFFNSADALVGQVADRTREELVDGQTQPVGVENVYEYEQEGVGNCQSSGGCVGLLSSGTSTHESAFLDASEDGDDAFFVTAAPLVPQDIDAAFDIYDARVCSVGSPCFSSAGGSSRGCESSATCRPGTAPGPQVPALASATFSGPGNVLQQNVLASRTVVESRKPPTRAQKLASALRACRKRDRKHKRAVCEAQARKRYGAKHAKKKAKKAAARDRSGRGAA